MCVSLFPRASDLDVSMRSIMWEIVSNGPPCFPSIIEYLSSIPLVSRKIGVMVVCVCVCVFVCARTCVCTRACTHHCSVLSDSLQRHGWWPTRLLCPWKFPGKNTGVCCHFLFQRVFLTQASKPSLLHILNWQEDSLPLHHLGRPIVQ